MKKLVCAAAAVGLLSGCASIIKGSDQLMTIRSFPEGATVSITNRAGQRVHTGSSPLTVDLKRGAGYFRAERYSVRFEKEGFKPKDVQVTASVNGWYVGNVIFGGLVGLLIVDPITGAMYTLGPDEVSAALDALDVQTKSGVQSLTVVLAQDLPASTLERAKPLL
jgi:hypothetical protein